MAQHTPGPWVPGDPGSAYEGHIISTGNKPSRGTLIAEMVGPIENETIAADARLIMAAPDMLAALKALVEAVYEHGTFVPDEPVDQANRALSKAEAR